MGEVRVMVGVRALNSNGHPGEKVEALADTGATLTLLPAEILRQAGVKPDGRVSVQLADGKTVERESGHAWVSVDGRDTACRLLFGTREDASLLGLTVLEQLGLAVDPVQRRLVPSAFKLL